MTQLAATFPNDDVSLLDNCKMFRSFFLSFFLLHFSSVSTTGSVSEKPAIVSIEDRARLD